MRHTLHAFCVAIVLVVLGYDAAAAQTEDVVRRYDTHQDGWLEEAELKAMFLAEDADILVAKAVGKSEAELAKLADDRVDDVLTFRCSVDCTTVSVRTIVEFVADRRWALGPTRKRIGWATLGFRRFVTDTADPRQLSPDKRPFLLSYKRDETAADKDQVNVLGGVQLVKWQWEAGTGTPRHYFSLAPGAEMDIDGGKKPYESAIEFGSPFAYEYIRTGAHAFAGATVSVTPKYLTDRGFDRSGWEVVTEATVASTALARMGYTTWLWRPGGLSSSLLSLYWRPSIRLETGEISDAAGNAKLAVLAKEGAYARITPRVAVVARLERWLPALTIGVDYFHRFNGPEGKSYGYGETRFTYDITANKALSFGVVVTRGRRPPDFAEVNRVLVGFGVAQ